jgi:shikimate kinase
MHDEGALQAAGAHAKVREQLAGKSIVLVGMMGAGKSSIGKRLAAALCLNFFDADTEIERAAGMSIPEIFAQHGERYFRDGEQRVIHRLLHSGQCVLATGGGAVISAETRRTIAERALSVWLHAPLDLLLQRVSRRDNRPLLKTGDPKAVMTRLLNEREPFYREADITFESRDAAHEVIVAELIKSISDHLALPAAQSSQTVF